MVRIMFVWASFLDKNQELHIFQTFHASFLALRSVCIHFHASENLPSQIAIEIDHIETKQVAKHRQGN